MAMNPMWHTDVCINIDIRVPRVDTHIKMHGIGKGPTVGPHVMKRLIIFKVVGPNQFLLMSVDGLIYPHLIEQSRLKAGTIWTTKGNVNNLADLRKSLSIGLSVGAN